jgi:hydrogenase-1 operon protein HyaF
LPDGVVAQIQEAVMAGLWRIRFTNAQHEIVGDYLEVASVPEIIKRTAETISPQLTLHAPPAGTMNVMPVLTEIIDHMASHISGQPAHTINFSLFPMSPEDMSFLQETLGDGPIQLISRGYGTCRITATGARHVWSVQYYNAMDTIILDTLEIGDVPVVACAAEADFRDSAERLREIEEAYFK